MKKSTAKKASKSKTLKCVNGRLRFEKNLQSDISGIIFEVNVKSMRNNFTSKSKKVGKT
jgi:hypothetical protein